MPITLTVPATKVRKGKAVKLVLISHDGASSERDDALVALVAEAARKAVLGSPSDTIRNIAARSASVVIGSPVSSGWAISRRTSSARLLPGVSPPHLPRASC